MGYVQFSREQHGKEKPFREREKEGGGVVCAWQFYWDSFMQPGYKENKLDTGEDRTSQRMGRSHKIRTYCQS